MFATDIHNKISENLMSAVDIYLPVWILTITAQN